MLVPGKGEELPKANGQVFVIKAINEGTGNIYYTSNESNPRQKHLYKINIDDTKRRKLTNEYGYPNMPLTAINRYYIDDYSLKVQLNNGLTGTCHYYAWRNS